MNCFIYALSFAVDFNQRYIMIQDLFLTLYFKFVLIKNSPVKLYVFTKFISSKKCIQI